MSDTVKITVDDVEYEVPAGMPLVDAVKQYAGIDIPVFCYHPKLGHDGNCRMCLIELGAPRKNRETGEMELAWYPKLETACTQKTFDGMAIRTTTEKVVDGRREILEFLLSSHPLDCPICDKGGECPLQNLTMRHGPGTSRMYFTDKMKLGKHVPLGELIYLDQERCIHCARCIRFSDQIADDQVLGFDQRGRKQQIITYSDPGFDSIFSGNTTDICPVGALTTADFRFNARPWEMRQVASLDSHSPEGANLSFDVRTDREAGGRTTIRRVMPRQNEAVNEIWISDKARFVRHYMEHPDRLTQPLIRKGGQLVEVTWEEALSEVATRLQSTGSDIAGIAGGRLSNEDYYALQKLIRGRGSNDLSAYPLHVAGAEFTAQVGVGVGTNIADLGEGDAIMVVASNLHEEAPIWWLRVKAAAERGAEVIVINGRYTRLDDFATHSIRYDYGDEVSTINAMLGTRKPKPGRDVNGLDAAYDQAKNLKASGELKSAAKAFAEAENAIILVGGEGVGPAASHNLTQAAANLLMATGHVGKPNNGLIVVWDAANSQGAFDMGFNSRFGPGYQALETPGLDYPGIFAALESGKIKVLLIAGADPVFDDLAAEEALSNTKADVIVMDMFLTETAQLADVVLPIQSIAEGEGTYTSGERRVQRFFQAIEPVGESKSVWKIAQLIEERMDGEKPAVAASLVFKEITGQVPQYAGLTYQGLAQVEDQWPDVSGEDLYYGGTAFQNFSGLGKQWPTAAEDPGAALYAAPAAAAGKSLTGKENTFVVVPVKALYDREMVVTKSEVIQGRVPMPHAALNPDDAYRLGIVPGHIVALTVSGRIIHLMAITDANVSPGLALIPRRLEKQIAPLSAELALIGKLEEA